MQTRERPTAAARGGLFRRLLLGPADEGSTPEALAPPVVDLSMVPGDEWQIAATIRVERLEQGLRLMAGTMKRAFVELSERVEDLRREVAERVPDVDVRAEVARALGPLVETVGDLAGSVERVPYILAAAADDLTDRMTELRSELIGLPGLDADPFEEPPPAPRPADPLSEVLRVTPFELEPLELGNGLGVPARP
jgi:hypothetical protein